MWTAAAAADWFSRVFGSWRETAWLGRRGHRSIPWQYTRTVIHQTRLMHSSCGIAALERLGRPWRRQARRLSPRVIHIFTPDERQSRSGVRLRPGGRRSRPVRRCEVWWCSGRARCSGPIMAPPRSASRADPSARRRLDESSRREPETGDGGLVERELHPSGRPDLRPGLASRARLASDRARLGDHRLRWSDDVPV